MRVACLPRVAQLGNGASLSLWGEDRVEPEALAPPRLVDDPALERPGAAKLGRLRRESYELADVSRTAALAFDAREPFQEPADGILSTGTG